MATKIQPAVKFETITKSPSGERSTNELFLPKDTLDQPCDVVLVVQDGKQFKAHRNVLSEASPFFEKLLNSGMKESKEGIVRLEMFSDSLMAAALEFIYTGQVQILTEDNARELIVMADYLFLQKLKGFVEGTLAQKLNISNCISTYYFSQRYQCEELLSKSKKFILANFTAVYAANREDVLNMSSKEVQMWISSDEINVSAEEDVFKIILAWIYHDKSKRKKYLAELFRQVRLVYVSRDVLTKDVVTNDLVKENVGCLELVKDAISLIDSKNCDSLPVSPRRSLETPTIVVRKGADFLCYFPGEDKWCRLGKIPSEFEFGRFDKFFPCEGKLYNTIVQDSVNMVSYSPYTNTWARLAPLKKRCLWKIFSRNEDEMYALFCDACSRSRRRVNVTEVETCREKHSLFISKYKPKSHSWEDIVSFEHFHPGVRDDYCIVFSGLFIYFIGGVQFVTPGVENKLVYLSDVDRYDFSKGQWGKAADVQIARRGASGAATNGKVFIAGGRGEDSEWLYHHSCEMYNETTNEWQFIASISKPKALYTILAADGKLYAVSRSIWRDLGTSQREDFFQKLSVECYNPEKNEWKMQSKITHCLLDILEISAPMRIFKGLSNFRPLPSSSCNSCNERSAMRSLVCVLQ